MVEPALPRFIHIAILIILIVLVIVFLILLVILILLVLREKPWPGRSQSELPIGQPSPCTSPLRLGAQLPRPLQRCGAGHPRPAGALGGTRVGMPRPDHGTSGLRGRHAFP